MVSKCAPKVREFVKKVATECPLLKVILTTSLPIKFDQEVEYKTQLVCPLTKKQSVDLFMDSAGSITG